MKKFLIYTMEGKKMCFLHALMNAKQLKDAGHEVKIVLEGMSCVLPKELEEEKNALYLALKNDGTIQGVCLACSKTLGVYEDNAKTGLRFLDDMYTHAGVLDYVNNGYEVLIF
ncbi:MAG TPA: hypothetical protein PK631_01360 [Erysipelotrichaceae bacterium]|jgi:hypothetical protein|nr:hypothetical protein [Erysipelotrichaceae bacterium]